MASASAAMASESAAESGETPAPSYYKYIGILLAVLSGMSILPKTTLVLTSRQRKLIQPPSPSHL